MIFDLGTFKVGILTFSLFSSSFHFVVLYPFGVVLLFSPL